MCETHANKFLTFDRVVRSIRSFRAAIQGFSTH